MQDGAVALVAACRSLGWLVPGGDGGDGPIVSRSLRMKSIRIWSRAPSSLLSILPRPITPGLDNWPARSYCLQEGTGNTGILLLSYCSTAALLLYYYSTATLLLYYCPTAALLLYYCSTAALLLY